MRLLFGEAKVVVNNFAQENSKLSKWRTFLGCSYCQF